MVSLEIYNLSIVFIGDFNPIIIQPFWLNKKNLIREQEATNAKVQVIHNELVNIDLDWAIIEVTKSRFEIKTNSEAHFETIRDLIISILGLLKETPIRMLGINHTIHYAINDEIKYYEFGNKLAPLKNWKFIFDDPRIVFLDILETRRKDQYKGNYRVRISPSDLIDKINYGVAINFNDHYDISDDRNTQSGELVKTLTDNWAKSIDFTKEITEGLWKNLEI